MHVKTNEILSVIAVFVISAAILWFSLAKSLNVYDEFVHAKIIDSKLGSYDPVYLVKNSFGSYSGNTSINISRSGLYVFTSYSFVFAAKSITDMQTDYLLNLLSVIFVAVSSVFVYSCSRLFVKRNAAFVGALVYTLAPYIFFNGINANGWSMQLMLASLWLFLALRGLKNNDVKSILLSSLVLILAALTYLSSTLLVFAQAYTIKKVLKRKNDKIAGYASLLPVIALIVYFSFVNKAYPMDFSPAKIVFSAALFAWEMLNGLTVPLFIVVSVFLARMFVNAFKRRGGFLSNLSVLSFLPFITGFSIFHYAPIFNFNPVFPLLALVSIIGVSRMKFNKAVVVLIIIAFIIPKTGFVYDQFHNYDHPHKLYAMWISEKISSGIVFAGHECPAIKYYSNLEVVCRGDNTENAGDKYVTSQYFTNENQKEIEYALEYFRISLPSVEQALERKDHISGRNLTKINTFTENTRTMEDTYEFLFSVHPSPFTNAFFYSSFPKITYSIYKVG